MSTQPTKKLEKNAKGCEISSEDARVLEEAITRNRPLKWSCEKKDLVFQILDWHQLNTFVPGSVDRESSDEESEDESQEDNSDEDDSHDYQTVNKKYLIRLYGVTEKGESVSVQVTGFTPYFFIKVPDWFNQQDLRAFERFIKRKCIGTPWDTARDKRPIKYRKNILACKLVLREDLYGFTDHKKFKYVYVKFDNSNAMRACANIFKRELKKLVPTGKNLKGGIPETEEKTLIRYSKKMSIPGIHKNKAVKYQLYESNIGPLLRMSHIQNLEPAGWVRIKKGNYTRNVNERSRVTKCQLDVKTEWGNVNHEDVGNKIAPYVIASFDIECTSGDGSFPQASRKSDKVIQIGTTISRFGESECYLRHIVTLKKSEPIKDAVVENYTSERKLLLGWAKFIQDLDPDILTGYNIWGFDMEYLFNRASLLECGKPFCAFLTRTSNMWGQGELKKKKLESSALGENYLKYIPTEGRLQIDLMKLVMRDYKLDSYKLDNVSSAFMLGNVKEIHHNLKKVEENDEPTKSKKTKKSKKSKSQKPTDDDDENENDNKPTKSKSLFDDPPPNTTTIKTNSVLGPKVGNYLKFNDNKGGSHNQGQKYIILAIDTEKKLFLVDGVVELEMKVLSYTWGLSKDDLTPNELFDHYNRLGDPKSIKRIAVYCLQDCELCNKLMDKLKIISSNVGMANVCSVPMSFLFTRGQGIKVYSLVGKYCRENKTLVPDLDTLEVNESYEGAIVLPPDRGIHQEPVTVLDYSSLYPSSMISENISHDTEVTDPAYDNLPDYDYIDIKYDLFANNPDDHRRNPDKIKVGTKTVRYAQAKNGEKGIIPKLLQRLLKARKTIKKKINFQNFHLTEPVSVDGYDFEDVISGLWLKSENPEEEKARDYYLIFLEDWNKIKVPKSKVSHLTSTHNEFEQELLDGLQLAYKLTCNSVYGQVGAATSSICRKNLAASTTATGRNLILFARDFTLKHIPGTVCTYGDTDSIMVKYPLYYDMKKLKPRLKALLEEIKQKEEYQDLFEKYKIAHFKDTDKKINNYFDSLPPIKLDDCRLPRGQRLYGKEMATYAIDMGQLNESLIQPFLKKPHVLEYEKTFLPFILFGKKRYENYKYEFNPDKFKRNFMGTELKRRDNSPIVKDTYGGVIDRILDDGGNTERSKKFFKDSVSNLLNGDVPLKKLIISKSLKSEDRYKNPESMAHVVLARRMRMRDPGNAPQANDRVPYVFIETGPPKKGQKLIQGDRVEHPDYIRQTNEKSSKSSAKIKPDYLYYLEQQVLRPVMRVFALEKLMNDKKGIPTPDPYNLIRDNIVKYQNERNKQRQISDFFKVIPSTHQNSANNGLSSARWEDYIGSDDENDNNGFDDRMTIE